MKVETKKSYYEVCMDLVLCSTQMIIGYICIDMIAAISLHFLSNNGSNIQVAGFGLANLLSQVFLIPFSFGLNQSLNQQVSQASAHNTSKLPFILLNFTIYQHVFYFVPVGFLMYCGKDLFRFLISENVDETIDFAWQALPLVILGWLIASEFEAFKIFLLPQKVFTPFVAIHFITLLGHIMWCNLFVQTFENKVYAVCTSIVITEISNNILFFIYINKTGLISHFKDLTLNFIMSEKFQLYKSFIGITIPQVFHIYATTVGFLALTLISIRLGTDAFNAQLALSSTSGTYFRIPFTISIAMMSLIGQQLGQGNIINAKNYFKFGIYIYIVLVGVSLFLFYGYKQQWAEFFSANENVSSLMLDSLISFLIGFVFFDGLQMLMAGGLKGLNHGYVVSHQTVICYIIIGTLLETYFAYSWGKGIQGIWVGFGIVNAILVLLFIQTLLQISWEKQAQEIQEHTKDQVQKADLEMIDLMEQKLLPENQL